MSTLLKKEIKLTASPLSFFFIAFALMIFIPNYPILLSAFFVCFGIFHSFQAGREAGDIIYTATLPVEKADVVRAKFAFTVFIQLTALLISAVFAWLRMGGMADIELYKNNALMNGNLAYLGYFLIVCAVFNFGFLRRFFKTAYNIGVPFLVFCIETFVVITLAEILHYIPGLGGLNSTVFDSIQLAVFAAGTFLYLTMTALSIKLSIKSFEKLDL